jgi:DNA ligase (NAD+)
MTTTTTYNIDELVTMLQEANDAYEAGHPHLTDAEYDFLKDELVRLDPANAFLLAVGAKTQTGFFAKVDLTKFNTKMGSQNKAMNRQELEAFWAKTKEPMYVASLKMDGMSILLVYINGEFKQAVTRGDGSTGDDVTVNVIKCQGVPLKLNNTVGNIPERLEVRGEVILSKSDFEQALKDGVEIKNQRNGTVGIIKDSTGKNCHRTQVRVYDIEADDLDLQTEVEARQYLESLGFTTAPWGICKGTWDSYESFFYQFADRATNLCMDNELPSDGIVVKVNSRKAQRDIGFSSNGLNPAYAIAHKYAPPQCVTIIEGFTWVPGPSGNFCPVANVRPTNLDNTELKNVSFYNLDFLLKFGAQIGSTISVNRAGGVIPAPGKLIKQ